MVIARGSGNGTSRPLRLVVDGQEFEVSQRHGRPGVYDFKWLSGPNPGYGFGCACSDGTAMSTQQLEDAIVNFLEQIDPRTGFIGD